MKKILLAMIVCLSLLAGKQSAAQDTVVQQTKYYYYPSSNVYFNPATNDYWYYDEPSTTWTSVKELPSTMTLVRSPRYLVYYKGTDVWKDNPAHVKKFKVKKNGDIKVKPKKDE